ncbi:MAG: hypothetical protein L0229_21235 [Blastocatellia bacterium]|nr:hypothetical protein [Blastocatellia bacterium]
MMKHLFILMVVALSASLLAGCSMISGETKIDEGVVIVPKDNIRSSTAMVALNLAEVKRGDRLDILEQAEVKTPTQIVEWYKVRTKDSDEVVGWIEANHVVNKSVVDRINELFEKSQQTPSQAQGRLKVQTRLRIEPDGDVITYLSRGTKVEIVGKARTTFKPEKQPGEEAPDEEVEEPESRTVLWYQIRLPESEVLRAGWVGARQVELEVPDEILHLEGEGRRFTGWIVFDQNKSKKGEVKNNYIGLMKSLDVEGPIDFNRLWVLNYSPSQGRYTGSYIEGGMRGVLPVTPGIKSGTRGFTIHELDADGKPVPIEYEAIRVSADRLAVRRISPKIEVRRPPRKPGK